MKCSDKEWDHCRVEKMGCFGCHYNDKSADEIFEELGTIKTETESFITYTGKINKLARILFNKNNESITFEGFNAIRINELKAINKKCRELGWI